LSVKTFVVADIGICDAGSENTVVADATIVTDTLQAKYHIRTGETEANFYIRDKHGSLLYFNDQGCDFSVQYYFPQLKGLDEYLRNFLQKSSFGKTSVVLL
jgi:hypothetical protein